MYAILCIYSSLCYISYNYIMYVLHYTIHYIIAMVYYTLYNTSIKHYLTYDYMFFIIIYYNNNE